MKRWLRESGQAAPELLKDALASRERWETARALADAQDAEYAEALADLNCQVALGAIKAWGRPSDTYHIPVAHRPREPVPANMIDELRQIDSTGCCRIASGGTGFDWLHDPGPFFYDIRFRMAEVKKQWPGATPEALPPPSRFALREWWRSYLQQHSEPDNRPTTPQQQADANAHFAAIGRRGPTVAEMRALRADPNTPEEWRESGRRPKSR